jgi:hypothetical protein
MSINDMNQYEVEALLRRQQQAGIPIRQTAALLRRWPWANGLVLQPGRLIENLHVPGAVTPDDHVVTILKVSKRICLV